MNNYLQQVSTAGRLAVSRKDWASVAACAGELLKKDKGSPEGYFLNGVVQKVSGRHDQAIEAFTRVLELDEGRYDAAIELAYLYSILRRHDDAAAMIQKYVDQLGNSPMYLNMAGTVYVNAGMTERAWLLVQKADALQPGVESIQINLATCCVALGKVAEAKQVYEELLKKYPTHQQNHYKLSLLEKAQDSGHIDRMKEVLCSTRLPPDENIFLYYGIGKELEDLELWDEAFEYFQKGGDAIASVADYDINADLRLIDTIIGVCNAEWLQAGAIDQTGRDDSKDGIFIVGLPRTGTTLTDRIIASHSKVHSVGETQFMQMVIRHESGVEGEENIVPEMIEAAAKLDIQRIGDGYMGKLGYRLGKEPYFVDKLPFNILYLGFIAKAFPDAKIIHLKRNPMDSCFAMYKQLFTWAYKFSYTQEGLGLFYPAYVRLLNHWKDVLGDRLIEVEYESLVSDQENQTRRLLDQLGLEFEEACLHFEKSKTATATASFAQVREKIHTRSVNRWKNYETQLQALRASLEKAGIVVD